MFLLRRSMAVFAAAFSILFSGSVCAADGVIEINDARASAGDVTGTGGDAPGYPVTIDTGGSYKLTGSLSVISSTAIEVVADGVEIDLNGQSINGSTVCSGSPGAISCPAGSEFGVDGTGRAVTVRNGSISGFSGGGVVLGDESRVEKLRAFLNGGAGIRVGDRSTVADNTAVRNAGSGLFVGIDCLVRNNDTSGNTALGLVAGTGTGFQDNVLNSNGGGAFSGAVDMPTNLCDGSLSCSAVAELCDSGDNDGDLLVDEDWPELGSSCGSSIGICTVGTYVCSGDQLASECNGVQPMAEICNALDDNCDGNTDEGNPGGGTGCSTGLQGVCSAGINTCTAGSLVCNQTEFPSTEVCDTLDNDCDGQTDEDFDLNTDLSNCGACGNVCPLGQVCNLGVCQAP